MIDQELLQWFPETGYRWRGWPRTEEYEYGIEEHGWWIRWPLHLGLIGWDMVVPTSEAACLVRDFLMFHPDMIALDLLVHAAPVRTSWQEAINAALVAAVEAQMAKEKL